MAKSNQSGANFSVAVKITDAIEQLEALQQHMNKILGVSGASGVLTLKLALDTKAAVDAIAAIAAQPITLKVNVDSQAIKTQIQTAVQGITYSPQTTRLARTTASNQIAQPIVQQQQQTSSVDTRILSDIIRSFGQRPTYLSNAVSGYNTSALAGAIPNFDYRYTGQIPRMPNNLSGSLTAFSNTNFNQIISESLNRQLLADSVRNQQLPRMVSGYNTSVLAGAIPNFDYKYTGQIPAMPSNLAGQLNSFSGMNLAQFAGQFASILKYTPSHSFSYFDTPGVTQKPFQVWGMTDKYGGNFPTGGEERDTTKDIIGLHLLSQSMSSIAYKLESAFDTVADAYDSSALSFRKTQLVGGFSGNEFSVYTNDLLSLAKETMTSVPVLAEMGYSYATRGYMNAETATDVLRPLAMSGLITGEDPVTMGKSVLSLMQTWNPNSLASIENRAPELVGDFADMTNYAFANSPLETRWFKDIANYAAPVFSGLGFKPTETMSMFMAMSQMIPTPGIGARSARMAVSNLFDINKLESVSSSYGIDLQADIQAVRDAGGGLAEVFMKLAERVNELPEWQRNTFMRTIGGGVRGGMALQALLPVIGNIQEYQRNVEAESEGYTYRKQLEYQATSYGQLQSAEAEREAILYGTGEKTVGIRTTMLKLENAILKLVQKLPEPVLAAGYAAGKGFEASAGVTSQLANLAILKTFTGTGGMLGGLGSLMGIGTILTAAIAAGFGAIKSDLDKGERQDDEDYNERHKNENVLVQAQRTIDDIKLASESELLNKTLTLSTNNGLSYLNPYASMGSQINSIVADDLYGDTISEKVKNIVTHTPFIEYGELQDKDLAIKRLQVAEELYAQSQQNIVKLIPTSEENKNKISERMSMENEWMQTVDLSTISSEGLKDKLKHVDMLFGDMTGIEDTDYVGLQKRSFENIDNYVDAMGLDKVKMPDLGEYQPESLISLRNYLMNKQSDTTWGDDDVTNISNDEIVKGVKEYFSADAFKGLYKEKGEDAIEYYTKMLQELLGVNKNFDDIKAITESINDGISELNSPMEASYGEMLDSWLAGQMNVVEIPGMNGHSPLSLAWQKGNFYETAAVGFDIGGPTYNGVDYTELTANKAIKNDLHYAGGPRKDEDIKTSAKEVIDAVAMYTRHTEFNHSMKMGC